MLKCKCIYWDIRGELSNMKGLLLRSTAIFYWVLESHGREWVGGWNRTWTERVRRHAEFKWAVAATIPMRRFGIADGVMTDLSVFVPYVGPELQSRTRYHYRIKSWDNYGSIYDSQIIIRQSRIFSRPRLPIFCFLAIRILQKSTTWHEKVDICMVVTAQVKYD